MVPTPPAVTALAQRLEEVGWVSELWVGGSLATGDYVPGVSDLDLVALVDDDMSGPRREVLRRIHTELDRRTAAGAQLGCVYVDAARLLDRAAEHPTWTHGSMVDRILSGVGLAELVRHGYAVLGRPPDGVLPPMTDDDVREAARAR